MTEERQLVILIGAARSGTKLLRDSLGAQAGICVVPYDVNFIWRLGHEGRTSDELGAGDASDRITSSVRRHLDRWWNGPVLVEKTVSNTLRVPFVDAIYPDAKFVHLLRDGFDVVESAYRQWLSPPDWRYLVHKLRRFPPTIAPRYVLRAGVDSVARQLSQKDKRTVPVWGPAYAGIEADLQADGVLTTCARQWRVCVETALRDLAALPEHRHLEVRYESFVDAPQRHLAEIAAFAGAPAEDITLEGLNIRATEKGKGLRKLSEAQAAAVEAEIGPLQRALGYA